MCAISASATRGGGSVSASFTAYGELGVSAQAEAAAAKVAKAGVGVDGKVGGSSTGSATETVDPEKLAWIGMINTGSGVPTVESSTVTGENRRYYTEVRFEKLN